MAENRNQPNPAESLFEAFRADHAVLGRGFHDISTRLRAGDVGGAREAAERVDTEAGAHIAFEEDYFYPALSALIGAGEIERMYAEHGLGLEVVDALCGAGPDFSLGEADRSALLENSEIMERHIADCGALFGALGGIPPDEQRRLLDALMALRREQPRWRRYAKGKSAGRSSRPAPE